MTVVIAVKDNDKNRIVMGADKRLTEGDLVVSDNIPKLLIKELSVMDKPKKLFSKINIESDNFVIGFSGQYALYELLKVFQAPVKSKNETFLEYCYNSLIPKLNKLLTEHNMFTDFSNGLTGIDWELIIVYKDKIYGLDFQMNILEAHDDYIAVGASKEIAYGSLHTALSTKFMYRPEIKNLLPDWNVEKAIEACAAHSTKCNDEFELLEIKSTGEISYLKQ